MIGILGYCDAAEAGTNTSVEVGENFSPDQGGRVMAIKSPA